MQLLEFVRFDLSGCDFCVHGLAGFLGAVLEAVDSVLAEQNASLVGALGIASRYKYMRSKAGTDLGLAVLRWL